MGIKFCLCLIASGLINYFIFPQLDIILFYAQVGIYFLNNKNK